MAGTSLRRKHSSWLRHSGARTFFSAEVTALAASRANQALDRGAIRNEKPDPDTRTRGELAALVFERFEQRQSHAEIVIGLRVEPEVVGELFEQYCLGLTERMLSKREPRVPLQRDIEIVHVRELEKRLAALPEAEVTRVSIARWRGTFPAGEDRPEYAWLVELGGFHVSGASTANEVVRRYGPGSYRVTAYGFAPPGLRWEVLIEDLAA